MLQASLSIGMHTGTAMPSMPPDKTKRKIIIRRVEAPEHPHGGAWKVAYADFVTAMMAFFLLMWLVNFVDDDTRRGLTNYFSGNPSGITPTQTGSGGLFGGTTENLLEGFMRQTGDDMRRRATPAEVPADDEREGDRARPSVMGPDGEGGERPNLFVGQIPNSGFPSDLGEASPNIVAEHAQAVAVLAQAAADALRQEEEAQEDQRFQQAVEAIQAVLEQDPDLRDIARQVLFQIEPEGLRVHFTEAGERAMFGTGSATPNPWVVTALRAILPTLQRLPNPISISGHTDSAPFRGGPRSNWELSAERAVAVQRVLLRSGLSEARIASVGGFADRRPLRAEEPNAGVNRRVSILLARQ